MTNYEDDEQEDSHQPGLSNRHKGSRKKYKYQNNQSKSFLLKVFICFAFWELYFIVNILLTKSYTDNFKTLNKELRLVNDYEGDLSLIYIKLLFQIWDENLIIRGKTVSEDNRLFLKEFQSNVYRNEN